MRDFWAGHTAHSGGPERTRIASIGVLAAVVLVVVAAVAVLPSNGEVAYATLSQATVLSPVDGAVSSNPAEPHWTPYGGDYSYDVHTSGQKRAVYARFRNASGALTLSVAQVARACLSGAFADGGDKVVLNVMISGVKVGVIT